MFKIPRRMAAVTGLNIRTENHGKDKVKAVDISLMFTGDLKLLDQLIPSPKDQDNKTSEFFFTEDGHLRIPTVNPVKINRNPEGLSVSLYDRKEPIVIASAKAKDFTIELNEGGSIKVNCKVQGIPDKGYVERLKDILGGSVEVSMEAETDDLFAQPEEEEEDKKQVDLLPDASRGKGGKGRNEGLRNSEVKEKDPVARLENDVAAANGKDDKKPKAKAVKKKSRGKRLGA
jgi:hypothetical protein